MPFYKLLKLLLSMYKTLSQTALNQFFEKEDITMSQQALSKSRSKFDHSPFVKLFTVIRYAFYAEEYLASLRRYCGKLIIAIDGSETALPNLPAPREKFGGTGSKVSSPTARMSIAYDVLDDIIIDAAFSPLSNGERVHAMNHIENIGNILVLKYAGNSAFGCSYSS